MPLRVVAEGGTPSSYKWAESLDALLDIPRPWSAADDEADHLQLARMQAVTRKRARSTVWGESPLDEKTTEGLLSQVKKLQGEDPLFLRLRKECHSGKARNSYELSQLDGLLRYKDKVDIPQQKALTQELLYLYHDEDGQVYPDERRRRYGPVYTLFP